MTIELINANYNDLITLINADIKRIEAEPNASLRTRDRDSAIEQIKEIITLINEEYNNSIIAIDYENNETEYYCKLEAAQIKSEPFEEALEKLKKLN